MELGKHRLFSLLALLFVPLVAFAQIRNTMGVDDRIFQRYAAGRLQPYAESNIGLADSIYRTGIARNSPQLQALGLNLEMSARFAKGEQGRMDAIAQQISELSADHSEMEDFYYSSINDYCQYLIRSGRIPDALVWAREMGREASEKKNAVGELYSWRLVGTVHAMRSNYSLAVGDFEKALAVATSAQLFNELPELYISIARAYLRLEDFEKVDYYRDLADAFSEVYPSVAVKVVAVSAAEMFLKGEYDAYIQMYPVLVSYPVYAHQIDPDAQVVMEVCYLVCVEKYEEALELADSIPVSASTFLKKHYIYSRLGMYRRAYESLLALSEMSDSLHLKVQNEDMAVLDAEMDNASLRAQAAELRYRSNWIVMLGLIVILLISIVSVLVSQWRMRDNLEEQRRRDNEARLHREEYQRSLDAKELENSMKVRILQNRKINNSLCQLPIS